MSQGSSYPSDPQVVHGASFVLRSYLALATPDTGRGAVVARYDPGSCCARIVRIALAPGPESRPRTSGIRTRQGFGASGEDSGFEVARQGLGDRRRRRWLVFGRDARAECALADTRAPRLWRAPRPRSVRR